MKNIFTWRSVTFVLFAGFVGLLAGPAWAAGNFYGIVASLDSAQQVPPNSSIATGAAKSSYDPATNKLGLSITVTGISKTNLTGAHIHLGAQASSGPSIVDLGIGGWKTTSTGITLTTTISFPEANELDLLNGNTYLNLHTKTYTDGEIRGQNIMAAKLVIINATPYAASADGTTVVGVAGVAGNAQAFRWTPTGGVQGIDFPPNAVPICDDYCALHSHARAVSANGEVIAGYAFTRQGTAETWEAFRWTATEGFLGLGNLSLYPYGNVAHGISDDGSTIVGGDPGGSYYGFRWGFRWTAAAGLVTFPNQPYIGGGSAYATSGNGAVSVGVNGDDAVEWPAVDQIVKLGSLIGGTGSSAYAISSDASVVAGVSNASFFTSPKAVRWITTNSPLLPVLLGDLPNETSSYAQGVSGDGKTIVGSVDRYDSATGIATTDGYVWTAQTGKRLLTDLMAERGVDVTDGNGNTYWRFPVIRGISRDATTIVGSSDPIVAGFIAYLNPAVTLPQPPPPLVSDVNATTVSGTLITWAPKASDPDGDPLSCRLGTAPQNGSATVASDCASGTYQSSPGFVGTDSFTYLASDGHSDSNPATVTVAVTEPPPSNPCLAQYPVSQFSHTGKDGTITIRFTGNIVSHTNKAVKVCPGTALKYQTSSTQGPVVCRVKNNITRGSGGLRINDHLKCTDKPAGKDKIQFKVKSGVVK